MQCEVIQRDILGA
jgi:hypothetical protein